MILGVTVGFEYKMRFVYAHFPINCTITGQKNKVEIRNFLGEKVVRTVDCYEGVTATRSADIKDEIVLIGNDIENVSKTWCAAPLTFSTQLVAALRGVAPCPCARGHPHDRARSMSLPPRTMRHALSLGVYASGLRESTFPPTVASLCAPLSLAPLCVAALSSSRSAR